MSDNVVEAVHIMNKMASIVEDILFLLERDHPDVFVSVMDIFAPRILVTSGQAVALMDILEAEERE